jgi:DNA-binding beta-propeller fold protein YncE
MTTCQNKIIAVYKSGNATNFTNVNVTFQRLYYSTRKQNSIHIIILSTSVSPIQRTVVSLSLSLLCDVTSLSLLKQQQQQQQLTISSTSSSIKLIVICYSKNKKYLHC